MVLRITESTSLTLINAGDLSTIHTVVDSVPEMVVPSNIESVGPPPGWKKCEDVDRWTKKRIDKMPVIGEWAVT